MTTKTNVYQELARLEGERDAAIAARAAEAAQHRQEKDTLRTMATRLTCWRCGTAAFQPNERCDSHLSWMDRLQTEVEHHNAWRKRADEAEARLAAVAAERDRLKAALQDVTTGMDRAGGDRDGMPECPWCQSQGDYDHSGDCALVAARAALTPQGQSTDGETR